MKSQLCFSFLTVSSSLAAKAQETRSIFRTYSFQSFNSRSPVSLTMKGIYIIFSLGLVSAINVGRQPQEAESGAVEGSGDNIFDQIINNNINNANREGEIINEDDDDQENNNNLENSAGGVRQGDLNLDDLNIDGLNMGNIDLNDQEALAQGILSMLAGFCLNNVLNQNNILNLGLNNELELFLELAQLAQLQQLGFLSGTGIRGLFNSGALLGGFNFGKEALLGVTI